MSQVPPMGYGYPMGMGMPMGYGNPMGMSPVGMPFMGIPPHPGTPAINASPAFQYNPFYNGQYASGLTTDPNLNFEFQDVNNLQSLIYGRNGLGFA